MDLETTFILLFTVATAVAIAARRMYVPYTVALVLAGLGLGALDLFPAPHLTKNLLFSVALPGLIFEAAFHINWREFRSNWLTIAVLAVPGVIASMALVTLALTPITVLLGLAPGLDWRHALVFGALISATDPVAVVALFRTLGTSRRLTLLLEGESLLNDGTAIVFFTLSLSLLAGQHVTPGQLGAQFVSIVGIGALVGTALGTAASLLMRQIDEPMIEITLTTIAAYGSFALAEALHSSGVIATVAAGMLCGNLGARSGMSASTRVAAESFWEYVVFALNSVVFLLIGFEVHFSTLIRYWLPILLAYLLVTLGRALVIALGRAVIGLTTERFPWRWNLVLTWGGLRGALPMVLALSLPADFLYRELIVSMTFGVAVLSILAQGLTMSTLLRSLGIATGGSDRAEYEVRKACVQSAAAALRELDRIEQQHLAAPEALRDLRGEYRQLMDRAAQELDKLGTTQPQLYRHETERLRQRLLNVERDQVMRAFQEGTIGRTSQQRLLADIDARALRPEQGEDRDTTDRSSPEK